MWHAGSCTLYTLALKRDDSESKTHVAQPFLLFQGHLGLKHCSLFFFLVFVHATASCSNAVSGQHVICSLLQAFFPVFLVLHFVLDYYFIPYNFDRAYIMIRNISVDDSASSTLHGVAATPFITLNARFKTEWGTFIAPKKGIVVSSDTNMAA